MLAQDFDSFGEQSKIIGRFGDNQGFPFLGPIKVCFLEKYILGIISVENEIYMQHIRGDIIQILIPESIREKASRKKALNALLLQIHVNQSRNIGNETEMNKSEEEEFLQNNDIVKYISMKISFLSRISTSNYFVGVDIMGNDVKVISKTVFSAYEEFGHRGFGPGEYEQPVSVSCLQVEHKRFYITTEVGSQRLQIIDETGSFITSSIPGVSTDNGRFTCPVSVSIHLPKVVVDKFKLANLSMLSPVNPNWYLGEHPDDSVLTQRFADETANHAGRVLVMRRPSDGNFDMMCQLDELRKRRDVIFRRSSGRVFVQSDSASKMGSFGAASADCVWDLLQRWVFLRKGSDPRPYALIAVADPENRTVQIFRFHWTVSDTFSPSLQLLYRIGGEDRRLHKLARPTCVAYSPTGELAVCDEGAHKVVVLSRYLEVLCDLRNEFCGPFNPLLETQIRPDQFCCSVSFSQDGKLAVGYRNGGVLVYGAYKTFDIGHLDTFTMKMFEYLAEFCDYHDFELLRNTCRCLHDRTLRLRLAWRAAPMRGVSWKVLAQYCFVKFCRLEGGQGLHIGPFRDQWGEILCEKHLNRIRGKGCHNKYCPQSHSDACIDPKVLDAAGACLESTGLKLAIKELYTATFLAYNEVYIDELFGMLSVKRILLDRSDPMTRHHEVTRTTSTSSHNVLTHSGFLRMMCYCEEAFTGCKAFAAQPAFLGNTTLATHLRSVISLSLSDLLSSGAQLYTDPLEQYDGGLDVPFQKSKGKRLKTIRGLQQAQGGELSETTLHIKTFNAEADRVTSLINRLFL